MGVGHDRGGVTGGVFHSQEGINRNHPKLVWMTSKVCVCVCV